MGIVSIELCLFISIIFVYTRLRKTKVYPIEMIRGLTLYLTPTQDDFHVLEESAKPTRESAKGKVNKYDAKHISKKVKFPMRTF